MGNIKEMKHISAEYKNLKGELVRARIKLYSIGLIDDIDLKHTLDCLMIRGDATGIKPSIYDYEFGLWVDTE